MRRLLWGLGVIAVLAGASLVLPPVASALIACPSIIVESGKTGILVAEGINFQATPEGTPPGAAGHFTCFTPLSGPLLPSTSWNLWENPAFTVLSDTLATTPHLISMFSEAEGGTGPTPVAGATNILEQPCSVLKGLINGGNNNLPTGGMESCDGAVVDLSPTVRLLILSDTPGNNDVPEPATGLLLGAALPALLGIRRQFSMRGVRLSK